MKLGNANLKGGVLTHEFCLTPEHKPFFRDNKLHLDFNSEVGDVDQSLLNIPLVASIVTYFWVMNRSLEIEVLDEDYVRNLLKLQKFFSDTYRVDLSSELIVKKTVSNTPDTDRMLLFFSGGLDSTYSLHVNRSHHPRMLMACGYDMYMHQDSTLDIRDKWRETYTRFAENVGEQIDFAYTNTRWLLDEDRVNHANTKPLKRRYWDSLRHGVCLTGLAAPLPCGHLIVSSNGCRKWDTTTYDNPYGTGFNIAPMLTYGGKDITYCCDADRFIKAMEMRGFLNSGVVTLKPCFKPLMKLNCMECEKCLRTLSQIVLAGVDPDRCGMHPPEDAWNRYLKMFHRHHITRRLIRIHFMPMQEYLRTHDCEVPRQSEKFYDYIKNVDFTRYLAALTS